MKKYVYDVTKSAKTTIIVWAESEDAAADTLYDDLYGGELEELFELPDYDFKEVKPKKTSPKSRKKK